MGMGKKNMKLRAFYDQCGGSYEGTIARFQGEERVLKFLRMLPADESLPELTAAMTREDAHTAFCAAHTIKGIALNLGLNQLATKASALTETLRGKEIIPPEAPELCKEVEHDCAVVLDGISRLEA